MGHRGLSSRHAGHTAAADVEFGPVAWTGDLKTLKTPVAERAPVVGADIVNAKVAVANLEQNHQPVVNFDQQFSAVSDLGLLGSIKELTHLISFALRASLKVRLGVNHQTTTLSKSETWKPRKSKG